MLSPPDDLNVDQIVRTIEPQWHLSIRDLGYMPVGFGAHHWDAETDRGRYFVTVHDLRSGLAVEQFCITLITDGIRAVDLEPGDGDEALAKCDPRRYRIRALTGLQGLHTVP